MNKRVKLHKQQIGKYHVVDIQTNYSYFCGNHDEVIYICEKLNNAKEYNQDVIDKVIQEVREGKQKVKPTEEILIFK